MDLISVSKNRKQQLDNLKYAPLDVLYGKGLGGWATHSCDTLDAMNGGEWVRDFYSPENRR